MPGPLQRLPTPGYQIVADPESFDATAAAFLARKLKTLTLGGDGSIAVSGGSTPGPIYARLAESDIDWSQLSIFFADERVVPLDHEASNYRLVHDTLLSEIEIAPRGVHPMPVEADDLEAAARDYAAALPERLDLLLLGLGTDGHTASLFPGSTAFDSEERVTLSEAPSEPRQRMTITREVIASARMIVILARGASKAAALRNALADGRVAECPARLARGGIWILGRDTVEAL